MGEHHTMRYTCDAPRCDASVQETKEDERLGRYPAGWARVIIENMRHTGDGVGRFMLCPAHVPAIDPAAVEAERNGRR